MPEASLQEPVAKKPDQMLSTQLIKTELNPHEIEVLLQCEEDRLAKSTRIAHESDRNALEAFCATRFPHVTDVSACTAEHVWAFIVSQRDAGLALTTIERRLSSMRAHIVQLPIEQWEKIDEKFTGMKRGAAGTAAPHGKDALLTEDLKKMVATCTTTDRLDVRDRALLLMTWFSAMRRGEVAALKWDHLTFQPNGVLIKVVKSKTDQVGNSETIGIHTKPAEPTRCAVTALLAWRDHASSKDQTYVFNGRTKDVPIDTTAIWRVVKRRCVLAGLDSSKYGAHSLRSGLITQGALNHIPVHLLQKQARHSQITTTGRYMRNTELLADDCLTTRL